MTIGQMTARTGVPPRLLRFYEDRNLIVPARDHNGYRVYCELGVERIAQIRTLLDAGLPTKAIQALLPRLNGSEHTALSADGQEVLAALRREATSLQQRINELAARRAAVLRYADDVQRTTIP